MWQLLAIRRHVSQYTVPVPTYTETSMQVIGTVQIFTLTWQLVHQLLQVSLGVAKFAEDLLGAVGCLDKGLVVGEGQLLSLSLKDRDTTLLHFGR